ncbi:MAG: hypothetical protein Q4P33_05145 [Flaviflexus sp.]|nr:hypothetical protein [Flaviflexus sp.]
MIQATAAGGFRRAAARSPIILASSEGDARSGDPNATFLFAVGPANLTATATRRADAAIVYLIPLTEDASPPPGLDRMLGEGEAALSPALQERLAQTDSLDRFGTPVMTIQPKGLIHPDETIGYARPRPEIVADSSFMEAGGFGDPLPIIYPTNGEWSNSPLVFSLQYAILVGIPLTAFLVAGSGRARHRRDINTKLWTMGYSFADRARWHLGSVYRPWLAGTLCGWLAAAPAFLVNIRLPLLGFTIQSADMRAAGLITVPLVAAPPLIYLAGLVLSSARRPRKLSHNRPHHREPHFSPLGATVAAASAPAAVFFVAHTHGDASAPSALAFLVACLVILLTIYHLIGYLLRLIGKTLRSSGLKVADATRIIAGAGIEDRSRHLARLAALLAVITLIGSQVLAIAGGRSPEDLVFLAEARSTETEVSMASLPVPVATATASYIAREFPRAHVGFTYVAKPEGEGTDKPAAFYASDDPYVTEAATHHSMLGSVLTGGWSATEVPTDELERLAGPDGTVTLIAELDKSDHHRLTNYLSALKAPSYQLLGGYSQILAFFASGHESTSWMLAETMLGITIAALLACLVSAFEIRATSRHLARLSVLYGDTKRLRRVLAWNLGMPPLLGCGLALIIAGALTNVLRRLYYVPVGPFIMLATGTLLIAAVLSTILVAVIERRTYAETYTFKAGRS